MRDERPDPDFATWVAGQEHQLLRAAYLASGDAGTARREVARALREAAGDWGRDPDQDVSTRVRTTAYGAVVRELVRREQVEAAEPAAATIFEDQPEESDEPDVLAALATLAPRERAALVLRHLEHRGEPVVARVLGVREGEVPDRVPVALVGSDLPALLERAADRMPSAPVGGGAQAAWAGARADRRSRRRRVLTGLAATALVAAVVASPAVLGRSGPDETPQPVPTTTTPAPVRGRTLDGVSFLIAPEPGGEEAVASGTVLPEEVVLDGPVQTYSLLPQGERGDTVAALVALRDLDEAGRTLRPVVLTRNGALVEMDEVTLAPALDLDGNRVSPMSVGAVTPDGLRVAFAQPGRVHVLDLTTGEVRVAKVPSEGLDDVGWGVGAAGIIASDDRASWFVDATTLAVTRLPQRASPGAYRLVADAQGQRPMALQKWDSAGRLREDPVSLGRTFSQVTSDTVASLDGRAATSVVVDEERFGPVAVQRRALSAIFVVLAVDPAIRSVLAFGDAEGEPNRFVACCTPLGWPTGTRLLFSSASSAGTWIMLWDVRDSTVTAVSRLRGVEGQTYPAVALGRVA